MSSHAASAFASDVSAFLKSAGISCTTPPEIFFCDMDRLSAPVGGQGDSGRGSQCVTQLDATLLLKRFPGVYFASQGNIGDDDFGGGSFWRSRHSVRSPERRPLSAPEAEENAPRQCQRRRLVRHGAKMSNARQSFLGFGRGEYSLSDYAGIPRALLIGFALLACRTLGAFVSPRTFG
jgi:hypothetical protein